MNVKRKYKYLMNINNNYLEVAVLYKNFVNLILNFEIEVEDASLDIQKIMAAKAMKRGRNLLHEFKEIQLEDENGLIIISGCTQNFAKILAMNNKCERIFGFQTNELSGQTVNSLMPKVCVETHDKFLINFIKSNRKINMTNHQFIWGRHKSGFIVPLIMNVSPYVNYEFNFCFIGFLKRSLYLDFNHKYQKETVEFD